jgi:hypothetical protein
MGALVDGRRGEVDLDVPRGLEDRQFLGETPVEGLGPRNLIAADEDHVALLYSWSVHVWVRPRGNVRTLDRPDDPRAGGKRE